MGGLERFLPGTYRAFLIGALALTGIPPLSGFFSKDSILASALAAGWYGQLLFAVGIAGAFLTGLYTFRMVFLVFGGEPSAFAREHFHQPERTEPWLWMGLAVGMLAVWRGRRRLDSDRRALDARQRLPGSGRRAARRAERNAGAAREPRSRSASGSPAIVVAWAVYSARTVSVPQARGRARGARAQVLLRRALRLGLLPADGLARAHAPRLRRAAASCSARSTRSPPARAALGSEVTRAPDRPRPHVRARDRRQRHRPRPRLRVGAE